jgi:hypothetical protein
MRPRAFERRSLAVVAGVVVAWVVLVTALHISLNSRGHLSGAAEARSLQVGGLPVT